MKRSITISEEHGVYRVRCGEDLVGATGRNVEDTILRVGKIRGLLPSEPMTAFEVFDLLEQLLGDKVDESGLSHSLNQ